MGQYFVGVIDFSFDGEDKPTVYENCDRGFMKLTEHSYWLNPYVNWFSHRLAEECHRVGWIGDYSDADGCPEGLFNLVHGDSSDVEIRVSDKAFTLDHKYLVNHYKREYLDCDIYYRETYKHVKSEWVPHPLPLLTSIGNGNGGGDYRGVNQKYVGRWFWDALSVDDSPPEGYMRLKIIFYEPTRSKKKK